GIAAVETSSCFHTIELVAGLNATSRLIDSAVGTVEVCSWMIWPALLITGCWSAAGGDSIPKLVTLAQTTSMPLTGSHDGSCHSTPPVNVGATTTYCLSL